MDYALYTFQKESMNPWTSADRYTQYHWARRRLEYIFRLMFAVTLDEVYTSGNYKPNLAEKIFPNMGIGTLGELWHVAVKYLIPRLPGARQPLFQKIWGSNVSSWLVEEYENYSHSTGMLGLKEQRNLDAHPAITPEKLQRYLGSVMERMRQIQELTGGEYFCLDENGEYEHSFVVIDQSADLTGSDTVLGLAYSYTGVWSSQNIFRRDLQRRSDPLGGQLYLKISRKNDLYMKFIRLSPFISFHDRKLSIYMGLAAQFSDCVQTVQIPIEGDRANEDKYLVDCVLDSLIPKQNQQDCYYSFSGSNNHHIQINISRYPDFEKLRNSSFPYCTDICDVVQSAEQFCQLNQPGASYRIIYGDGGVGKTTLVFHLIHDIILRGRSMFSRVIFLSAKNYFRKERSDRTLPIRGEDITPDFSSYEELLGILHQLICQYPEKAEVPDTIEKTEAELLNKINHSAMPKTILILDDLDTLTEPEQSQVRRLLSKTNGKWVKTLITTRSHKFTTEQDFPIKLLDQEQSMKFLHWCIKQRHPENADSLFCSQVPSIVHNLTDGRPIDLYAWASLVIHGYNNLPAIYTQYLHPREKTKYLYRTVMQNLSSFDQMLFRLLCGINEAACTPEQLAENFRIGIPMRLIQYLLPNHNVTESSFSALIEFKLVVMEPNTIPFGVEYRLRDFCYLDILENNIHETLPGYLKDILKHMKKDGNWLPDRYTDRLTIGICFLLSSMVKSSEVEKKEMLICMIRNMLSSEHRNALTEAQIKRLSERLPSKETFAETGFYRKYHDLHDQIQRINNRTSRRDIESIYNSIAAIRKDAKTQKQTEMCRELFDLYSKKIG